MENPKSKPTASYFIFIFDRETNSNALRSFFFPSGNQARTQSFKNPFFRYLNPTFTCWSLCTSAG